MGETVANFLNWLLRLKGRTWSLVTRATNDARRIWLNLPSSWFHESNCRNCTVGQTRRAIYIADVCWIRECNGRLCCGYILCRRLEALHRFYCYCKRSHEAITQPEMERLFCTVTFLNHTRWTMFLAPFFHKPPKFVDYQNKPYALFAHNSINKRKILCSTIPTPHTKF